MKKILSVIILTLAGTYVLAQTGNIGNTVQEGDFNFHFRQQSGIHSSDVYQNSSAGTVDDKNVVTVTQSNRSLDNLTGNESIVKQYGLGHESTITQIGKNNAETYIGADGLGNIDQNTNNTTSIYQYGADNYGKQVVRGGSANESYLGLEQYGTDNQATQIASWSTYSTGFASQAGSDNSVWQQVDGTVNSVSVVQSGDRNTSFQWIKDGSSSNNSVNTNQSGNENNARIVTKGNNNEFLLTQNGHNNQSVGTSGDQYSNGIQTGNVNNTKLSQYGNNNQVMMEQVGDGNSINGYTFMGAAQVGDHNTYKFSQNGLENKSFSNQFGDHNRSDINQNSNGSISNISQQGQVNSAIIFQGNL